MRIKVPSARNIEIYHRLEDDAESIRDVAEDFWVSPTRITQIHGQVHRWHRCSAPDPEMDRFRRQHAVAACRRHVSRAGRLFGRMMDAFRDSQGEERRTREGQGGVVATTRMCHGDPKFLDYALKYSREQRDATLEIAKLPDEYFLPMSLEFVEPTAEEPSRSVAVPVRLNMMDRG